MATVEVHELAWDELHAAKRYYSREAGKAVLSRFIASYNAATEAIEQRPMSQARDLLMTRFVRIKKFPYKLVFQDLKPDFMLILAVAHLHRRPGYWRKRVRK